MDQHGSVDDTATTSVHGDPDTSSTAASLDPHGSADPEMLGARPFPIKLDLDKTVVIVADMQNDFGSRGGMFDRGVDISAIQGVVAPINAETSFFASAFYNS